MAALRAGYLVVMLSVLGTLAVALAVLAPPPHRPGPTTVAEALGIGQDATLDRRRALAVALRTHACMAALGLPHDPVPEPPPPIPDAHLDPVAWAARWGFGIATSVRVPAPMLAPDPNADRLATMTGAERARYTVALYGEGRGRDRSLGCHGTAVDAVYGLRDRALEPLRERLDALRTTIDGDPAIPALDAGWDACVRSLGIPLTDRSTLIDRMRRSFTERTAAVQADARLVAAVAEEERRIASGIARCEATHAAGMAAISAPYEARFVATYRSLLARIGARIQTAEAAYPLSRPAAPWPRPAGTAR